MILLKKLKIAIFMTLVFISLSNVVLSNALSFEGKIHKNVYVRNVNLSYLTKDEATIKINDILNDKNSFILKINDKNYIFNKEYIDVDYHVDEIVNKAYSIGRDEGIISNFKTKTDLDLGEHKVLQLNCTYNERKLNDYLRCLNEEIYTCPINSHIVIKDDNVFVTQDKYGYKLNTEKMKAIILDKVKNLDCKEESIPIIIIKPEYSYEELSKIDTVLGRFYTKFNPKNENRVSNIRLASKATNKIILKENDVFSFNNSIKDANISEYFKEAPVIVNGKPEKGLGGGMCQVSSTIYNAALYSGLKIITTTNHSIPSTYIEKGRDATICKGYIDLKIQNTYKSPIYIYNQVYDDRIISTIYGNKLDSKNIDVITETVEVIPIKTVIKKTDKLKLGENVVQQEGRKGYKVRTYRVYKYDYKDVREFICESYYPSQEKIIICGTGEVVK